MNPANKFVIKALKERIEMIEHMKGEQPWNAEVIEMFDEKILAIKMTLTMYENGLNQQEIFKNSYLEGRHTKQ